MTEKSVSEELFSAIGMKDLTDEQKAALFLQMLDLIQTRVIAEITDKATESQREELEAVINDGQPADEMQAYLDKNFPEYPEIFENESRKLREELIIKFSK
ncbi:MAG: DUF5663 domain-containing protein [Candidatus Berkelbacteria bacterium]|nr:DUF5663 domain-containing protein [Candidatus Berkelbacteria bacterium]